MAGVVGAVLGVVVLPVVPAVAAPAAPACAKVELVTFRGSGEDKVDDGAASDGFSGSKLQRIIDKARTMSTPDGYALADAPVFGVPYPAVPASQWFAADKTDLFDSLEYGRLLGAGYLQSRHETCPDTRFLLAGYSQGVLAARQVAADLPSDEVAGVFGIGDPAQRGGAYGATGPGANGNGVYRWLIQADDGTASSDAFYDLRLPSYLFCHAKDPVCDFRGAGSLPLDFGPHTTYGDTDPELTSLARKLLDLAASAANRPRAAPVDPGAAADLMFVIDTTGSMSPYLAAAVASASRTAEALHAKTSKARVGVVEYRDQGDSFVARTVVALTDDFAAFDAGLRGLVADGGGDDPESVYSGIVTALGANWDPGASRSLIVLGDAPAHDPEPVTGLTAASVTAIAKGTAPMPELPPTIGGSGNGAVAGEATTSTTTPTATTTKRLRPAAPRGRTRLARAAGQRLRPGRYLGTHLAADPHLGRHRR